MKLTKGACAEVAPKVMRYGCADGGSGRRTDDAGEVKERRERPGSIVLDLEWPADRATLAQPSMYFPRHREQLVVLDEVRNPSEVFTQRRPEINAARHPGRFVLHYW